MSQLCWDTPLPNQGVTLGCWSALHIRRVGDESETSPLNGRILLAEGRRLEATGHRPVAGRRLRLPLYTLGMRRGVPGRVPGRVPG